MNTGYSRLACKCAISLTCKFMRHWLKGISIAGLLLASGNVCISAPKHQRPVQKPVEHTVVPATRTTQPTILRSATVRRPEDQLLQPDARSKQVRHPATQQTLSMQQVNQFAYREAHSNAPGIPVEQANGGGQ